MSEFTKESLSIEGLLKASKPLKERVAKASVPFLDQISLIKTKIRHHVSCYESNKLSCSELKEVFDKAGTLVVSDSSESDSSFASGLDTLFSAYNHYTGLAKDAVELTLNMEFKQDS